MPANLFPLVNLPATSLTAISLALLGVPAHAAESGATAAAENNASDDSYRVVPSSTGEGRVPDTEITVTAYGIPTRIDDTGQSVTVIGQEEIQSVQGADIVRVLERAPGITITRNGGIGSATSVRIRGSQAEQVLVLIDGVRVADSSSPGGGYDFGNLLPGNLSLIEILRGSNSTVWGSQAIGGVILARTGRADTGASVSAEVGSRGTYYATADAAYTGDRFGVSAYGNYFETDGFSVAAAGTEDDAYRQWSGGAAAYARLTDWATLNVQGRYSDSRVEFDFPPTDTNDVQDTDQYSAAVSLDLDFADLGLTGSYSLADTRRRNDSDFGPFGYDGYAERIELRGHYDATDSVTLRFGGEYEWTNFDSTFDQFSTQEARAAYGQAEYDSGPLSVAAGVRVDDYSAFGSQISLGGNASLQLAEDVRLRASVGEGYKAPTLYQQFGGFVGNPDLEAESATSYDIGLDYGDRATGALFAAVTLFRRDTDNQIDLDGSFVYFNIDRARAQGAELELALRPSRALQVAAAYTYLDTENRTVGSVNEGKVLGRRPKHNMTVSADWETPLAGLTLGGDIRMVGDSFDTNANLTRLDGYQVVTLRASMPVTDQVELFGRVENVFDSEYQTAARYNTPGRGVFVGVRAAM